MAYEKQSWSSGDVVTSSKLNHIEGGIEEAASTVYATPVFSGIVGYRLNKTAREVLALYREGKPICINVEVAGEPTEQGGTTTTQTNNIAHYLSGVSVVNYEPARQIPQIEGMPDDVPSESNEQISFTFTPFDSSLTPILMIAFAMDSVPFSEYEDQG